MRSHERRRIQRQQRIALLEAAVAAGPERAITAPVVWAPPETGAAVAKERGGATKRNDPMWRAWRGLCRWCGRDGSKPIHAGCRARYIADPKKCHHCGFALGIRELHEECPA